MFTLRLTSSQKAESWDETCLLCTPAALCILISHPHTPSGVLTWRLLLNWKLFGAQGFSFTLCACPQWYVGHDLKLSSSRVDDRVFCQIALKLVDKSSSDPVWHPFDADPGWHLFDTCGLGILTLGGWPWRPACKQWGAEWDSGSRNRGQTKEHNFTYRNWLLWKWLLETMPRAHRLGPMFPVPQRKPQQSWLGPAALDSLAGWCPSSLPTGTFILPSGREQTIKSRTFVIESSWCHVVFYWTKT